MKEHMYVIIIVLCLTTLGKMGYLSTPFRLLEKERNERELRRTKHRLMIYLSPMLARGNHVNGVTQSYFGTRHQKSNLYAQTTKIK